MTKYVLLKQAVPVTFDGGFRMSGYDVLEIVETDDGPNEILDSHPLKRIINQEVKLAVIKASRKKKKD